MNLAAITIGGDLGTVVGVLLALAAIAYLVRR